MKLMEFERLEFHATKVRNTSNFVEYKPNNVLKIYKYS